MVCVHVLSACTQERQNQIKRDIQNWTGTNGVLGENGKGPVDGNERCVYFEMGDFSHCIFFENPN